MLQKFRFFSFIFNSFLVRFILLAVAIITLILNVQSRIVFAQSGATGDLVSGTTLIDGDIAVMELDSANDLTNFSNGPIYLPLVLRYWPPHPVPNISPINNLDQDNFYSVTWQSTALDDIYILEEAINQSFSNPVMVYQGPNSNWTVPGIGKLPGTYYYRVKATNTYSESDWSDIRSVTIYPLFVGLQVRWDGNGYINLDEYYEVGTHDERVLDVLTEPDTIRSNNHSWYKPDPEDFGSESWSSYYSVSTGSFKGSSYIGDPAWKWGYSWKLGYYSQFVNGETVEIDGQKFTVTGPHNGVTTWGISIQYWEFTNQEIFLYEDSGGDWTQYVHAGDIVLRYDTGNSRLLLYDMVLRHFYYQGDLTPYSVQYVSKLTSATSIPNSPPLPAYIGVEEEPSKSMLDSISPNNEFQKRFIQTKDQEYRGNEKTLR